VNKGDQVSDWNIRNPQWYKDAVIYELHVRAFYDSNDDGMGDFKGLSSKLDYLQDLGINAIWLLPFYPSPWRDDGYDISDYRSVHEAYGSMRDFKTFLKRAHQRGLRVITELVINHTSNQHPWFERARHAKPGSKYRDYYVWSDDPEKYSEARIIFQDFETSNWTWDPVAQSHYWHRFYSHQPDLNFDNPDVQAEVFKLLDYWFGLGVDGLRLDAVPYLFERENTNCENLPETHDFLKQMRSHVDTNFPGRMLLAEANQWPEDAVSYFGDDDECHMAFHFPIMPRLFMAMKMEDSFPVIDILEQTPAIPESAQWGIFLRNHDELTLEMVTDEERDYMYRAYGRDPRHRLNLGIRRRLAPLLDNNRRGIELLNSLLFSLPGTPVIYYGDEIGMGDNVYLGDRDGVRTPMQWSSDKNAGFSGANPQRLFLPVIIDPEYHHEALNVETQQANGSSLLWWMKRLIATRRRFPAFSRGDIEMVTTHNHRVFAFIRRTEEESILIVVNFSRHTQLARLDLADYAAHVPEEVFSNTEFPTIGDETYPVTIGSNDFYWLLLKPVQEELDDERGALPTVELTTRAWTSFAPELTKQLESRLLLRYMRRSRWFRQKSLKVRKLEIEDAFAFGKGENLVWSLHVGVEFSNDQRETYVVPLAIAMGERSDEIVNDAPGAAIARIGAEDSGLLYDGIYSETFRNELLQMLARRKRTSGRSGSLQIDRSKRRRQALAEAAQTPSSRVLRTEQSNSSILYGEDFFLKVFRKLERGINPDVELGRYLSEEHGFAHVPPYVADVRYQYPDGEEASMGIMIDFVPNQGTVMSFTRETIDRYFDTIVSSETELSVPKAPASLFDVEPDNVPEQFLELEDGFFLEMVELLGRRTGEMHLMLGAERDEPAYKPEPFSRLYQRSLYQSLRSLLRRTIETVRSSREEAPAEAREQLDRLLGSESRILERFSKITSTKIDARKIRIHGDYHLEQVLFTGRDFVIIDMEGEPARSLSERRLKFSAFRDVAGMIRSFHYAIHGRYLEAAAVRPEDADALAPWVRPWYTYVSGLFLNSYLETVDDAPFVPSDRRALETLLDVFLLEKAVYEVGYESNNRPDWVRIPLDGIEFVLEKED
jgi:maltose alpha-D-glucosyltransferase/alpha-amylase